MPAIPRFGRDCATVEVIPTSSFGDPSRYDAAKAYWAKIQGQIGASGHNLRPEIQTLLNGAARDVSSGQFAVQHLDAPNLQVACKTLTKKLDDLDSYR